MEFKQPFEDGSYTFLLGRQSFFFAGSPLAGHDLAQNKRLNFK